MELVRPVDVVVEQTDAVAGGAELPSGTVTFLLTDVEGSSRLWEERPEEAGAAIARHYEILGEAIAEHHGVRPVEQGEGDSVVAAFASAGLAVRAAVEGQRRLAAEIPWLRVRMALHSGEAQQRDEGNYMGRTIIRGARLRACAHGGQIVLSSTTAALAAEDLDDASLVDLGSVQLRDLLRPEHVWQAVAPGLVVSFPPLRSQAVGRHNLPAALTSFIGRERELDEVATLVSRERIVTLTGSGGCGKTRLALHVAADLVDSHSGGTWWADLASVSTDAGAAEKVVSAVGASTAPGAEPEEVLLRHLRDVNDTLVVIDNAEHLVGPVASLVERLLAGCAGVRVLVTSREPLGVGGEALWRVPSLTLPAPGDEVGPDELLAYEAPRLFVERARSARPNFALDVTMAGHVGAICQRLDGIPLALELAAARIRTLPVDRLARDLDQAFRLLTGGARTAMARQQTLLASIAWSVDLLDDLERAVLRRLAVFLGPFPLEAAEAVAADGEVVIDYDVLDLVSRLVDKSLVLFDHTTGRYRLLETIRQFALDRLRDARELTSTRDRHAAWCAAWCESLGRGEHDFDIDPSHPTLPDVFAALDWACERDPHIAYRMSAGLGWVRTNVGRFDEFDRQLAWVAAQDPADNPQGWAKAVAGLSLTAFALGEPSYPPLMERAEDLLDPADTCARRMLRYFPAVAGAFLGDLAELEGHVAAARDEGDDWATRELGGTLAIVHVTAGRVADAEECITLAERMVADRGLPVTVRTALLAVSMRDWVLLETGELQQARERLLTTSRTDHAQATLLAGCAGEVARAMGDVELARAGVAWQAGAMAGVVAHRLRTGHTSPIEGAGVIAETCVALLECSGTEALPLLRRRHHSLVHLRPSTNGFALVPLGVALLAAGERIELEELLAELQADLARRADAPLGLATFQRFRALVARADGEWDGAWEHAHTCLSVAHPARLRLVAVDALHLLAELAHRRGQPATAARLFAAVATERHRIGYVTVEVPDPATVAAAEAEARAADPAAWTEGGQLGFDEAVELAQRSRGERRRPTTGWASLTPTETKVVELVAEGHSNEQVARRLLMSVATVKTHLTHVYAKTGTTNRTELAARYLAR